MQLYSTVTQKGQVLIPKEIRDATGISLRGRVQFSVRGRQVLVQPVTPVDTMLGFIKAKLHFTQRDYTKVIEQESIRRFKQKVQ